VFIGFKIFINSEQQSELNGIWMFNVEKFCEIIFQTSFDANMDLQQSDKLVVEVGVYLHQILKFLIIN
jgi:hypothetical protein